MVISGKKLANSRGVKELGDRGRSSFATVRPLKVISKEYMYPRICDQNQCMGKFCLSVISDSLSTTGLHKYRALVYLTSYVGSIALQLIQWRKQNPIVKVVV